MAGTEDPDPPLPARPLGRGAPQESSQLLSLCYDQLHKVAEELMKNQPAGHTLQATALVSEAYLRLAGGQDMHWKNRAHLLRAAAKAMRCVLVDHARRRATRQVAESDRSALDGILLEHESRAGDLLRLERALEELGQTDPEMVRAVELHFFAGLPMGEVAEILEMPLRTLEREWQVARAWLHQRLA